MAARNNGIAILLGLVLAGACGRGGKEAADRPGADSAAAAPEEPQLSDNQALDVLMAMSGAGAEVAGNIPATVAAPEVRRYLNVVRADHVALQEELRLIADSLQLAPEPHPTGERMRAAAQDAQLVLGQQAYGAADLTALQQESKLNTLFLGALDSAVLRGPRQELLARYAKAVRPTISAHLQRAVQLETMLRERPTSPRAAAVRPAPLDTPPRPRPAAIDVGRRTPPDTVPSR
ncbi:MAG: hypothetical protein FIB01_04265 [Gemmatimonadetes bacterium]|nr:hypothetical protein [Gemmatimonadota bacterium]